MNRARAALLALTGLLLALLPSVTTPAAAAADDDWSATGPGITAVDPGNTAAASLSYDYDPTGPATPGSGVSGSWTFTTAAGADGTVTVPWSWRGSHAYFNVRVKLELLVAGRPDEQVFATVAPSCCDTPAVGFSYGGVAQFTGLTAGQVYGFRLSGSNFDTNDFLNGTFTLSTKPYIEELGGEGDNRQWLGAPELADVPVTGRLMEPGEARWWKVKVVPGQRLRVDLSDLPGDYDLALYGDIGAAFSRISGEQDLTELVAGTSASTPGSGDPVPDFPASVATVPTAEQPPSSAAFAPRVYAPRVYAPRVYAPRVYAPRVYAPRVYAPRVYAADAYAPGLGGSDAFRDAFAAAQTQTLLAVSASSGLEPETVTASTGDATGFFYVRVQAHDDTTYDDVDAFTLARSLGGGQCDGVRSYDATPTLPPTPGDFETVVLTDTDRLLPDAAQATKDAHLDKLGELADATSGVVVDLAGSDRIDALWDQIGDGLADCTYAADLVADAARDIVGSYRTGSLKYVVIAGGDDVVPFFRYPDRSGLGQESQFELKDQLLTSPAQTALLDDQVLSQDAYGSQTDLTVSGGSLAVPDLGVGRLVKTPEEIADTIDHFVRPDEAGQPAVKDLPTPRSSLVTGYDFLADAAEAVDEQFAAALGAGGRAEKLVSPPGTPYDQSWDSEALFDALTGDRHDLVFLAGHFSANDTLAADFDTTLSTDELALGRLYREPGTEPVELPEPTPADFTDSLVISPGCHSGYVIPETALIPGTPEDPGTNGYDWTQYMAQQHAVLVAGTGYQYGDTELLDYSERLYLQLTRELRKGTGSVSVGDALVRAKRSYLASLATLTGVDQKAVQQATLYGLPMTGLTVADSGRLPADPTGATVSPDPVGGTGPGSVLGLRTHDLDVLTDLRRHSKASQAEPELDLPAEQTWFTDGPDGFSVQPGAPVQAKKLVDVTADDTVLRGVGFRTGTYREESGLLPLTGAPAIEGPTPHTTFFSPAWFPQQLTGTNYFSALDARGASGRTSLVVTPTQWRSDPGLTEEEYDARQGAGATNTVRAYSDLGVRLFYNDSTAVYGDGNQPALAVAPSISDVRAFGNDSRVRVSARVAGDPSAGVEQVWVTWTAGPGADQVGTWQSVDLTQDSIDSTLWSGEIDLPTGTSRRDVRLLLQAVNGVGVVALDADEGNGHPVLPEPTADGAQLSGTLNPVSAETAVATPRDLGRFAQVVVSPGKDPAGYTVRFAVSQGGELQSTVTTTSGQDGVALLRDPGTVLRPGPAVVEVQLLRPGSTTDVIDSFTQTVDVVPDQLSVSAASWLVAAPGQTYADSAVTATLTDARGDIVPGATVTFSTPTTGPTATFATPYAAGEDAHHAVATTGADGKAVIRTARLTAGGTGGTFAITASSTGSADATADKPLSVTFTMGKFISPVLNKAGTTSAKVNSSLPVKIAALNAGGRPVDDAAGAAMAQRKQVEVTWRLKGTTTVLGTVYSTYVPDKDHFQADLKLSTANKWAAGKAFVVTVTVHPWWDGVANRSLVLGQSSFEVSVTK